VLAFAGLRACAGGYWALEVSPQELQKQLNHLRGLTAAERDRRTGAGMPGQRSFVKEPFVG
jgi:hypothetical protein